MVSLAEIERATARRVGPYFQAPADRQAPSTAHFEYVLVPSLRSTVEQDLVTNLWLLRRDASVLPDDRQRLVANYDPERGQVTVDRPWSVIPAPGEVLEFHHLNPELELREAVRAGLRRTFFADTIQALLTSQYGDVDLTAQAAWLTAPSQVLRTQYGWGKPQGDAPFEATMLQGHVMLSGTHGSYAPANTWVTALRPHWSWVNGADSDTGPLDDDDELAVDLDYAASAGHIEAWHLFPHRLQAAAAGNLQATQKMAAEEFTRQSMIWGPSQDRRFGFSEVFGHTRTSVVL